MWSEACEMLSRAERLNRQFFHLSGARRVPVWEPPVDVLETARELLIFVALPGVDPDRAQLVLDGSDLVITGTRILPPELQDALIHRLELPQGRFERRIPLPAGRYGTITRAAVQGCVLVRLGKAA